MGSFVHYWGSGEIPEEKKSVFTQQMRRILDLGGMMDIAKVRLFDKTIPLLRPVSQMTGKDFEFYYNYFEERGWESAGFNSEQTHFWSGKVGNAEFSDTMVAACMLYELYLPGYGPVMKDADFVEASRTVGWLNQILGTKFSMEGRANLWECIEQSIDFEYNSQLNEEMLRELIPINRCEAAGGTDLADLLYIIHGTENLSEESVTAGTYPADVLHCKQELMQFLNSDADVKMLWGLLEKPYEERSKIKSGVLATIAQLTLEMPARVFVYLTAELQKRDFWKIWETLFAKVYYDEQPHQYASEELAEWRRKKMLEPFEPIRTSEYLRQDKLSTFAYTPKERKGRPNYYLSDDDRLFWWDGTDEVQISEEMDRWLKECSAEHQKIMKAGDWTNDSVSALRDFVDLLNEVDDYYWRIIPFETMFYDFTANLARPEYRAAIQLIRETADSEKNRKAGEIIQTCEVNSKNVVGNEGRLEVKRLYAVLANKSLRKKYFDF